MVLISRDGKSHSERRLKKFYQKERSAITCLFLDPEKFSYKKYNSDVDCYQALDSQSKPGADLGFSRVNQIDFLSSTKSV